MGAGQYAVILAGGRGERFWPLSTSRHPKQLLSLVGDTTLLAQAVERLDGVVPPDRVFVITSRDLLEATRAAAPILPAANVVGEPVGRDTAPAVALATALVKNRDPGATFCILTADHIIGDIPLFRDTLRQAMALSLEQDVLITIGIRPDHPSTGYGYIEAETDADVRGVIEFSSALRFVEKPDRKTAAAYLERGTFFWNSGMFIWSVASLERAFRAHCPELGHLIERLLPFVVSGNLDTALDVEYPNLTKISVDYALMEKAENIVMARGAFAWDDVGSWPALENHFSPDENGSIHIGTCEALDSNNNVVVSKDQLTALIGVRDLVVVQAAGATLICAKDHAQDVKKLVLHLRERGHYDEVL